MIHKIWGDGLKRFYMLVEKYKQVNVIYYIVSIKSMVTYEKFEYVWTLEMSFDIEAST